MQYCYLRTSKQRKLDPAAVGLILAGVLEQLEQSGDRVLRAAAVLDDRRSRGHLARSGR